MGGEASVGAAAGNQRARVAELCRDLSIGVTHSFERQRKLSEVGAAQCVEVRVAQSQSRAMEVRLAGGHSVLVEAGFDAAHRTRIWLAAEPADMRSGFNRIADRVKAAIGEDLLSGHLFVFRGRRGDRLEILVRDRDGSVLRYERLASLSPLP